MIFLGGFINSCGQVLFVGIAPLAALVLFSGKQSLPWLIIYIILLIGDIALQFYAAPSPMPLSAQLVLLVINATTSALFVFGILYYFVDQRNLAFRLLHEEQERSEMLLLTGASFRAITNSYRLSNGSYIRIDDNQVSAYLDYYPAKHIALTLEPGYGIFRKLRTGIDRKNYIVDYDWNDGPFVKLSASWRIRL